MVDIDSETLFNGAAATLTTIAVLFFVFNVELNFSPVTKIAIVLAFLSLVLAISQRTADPQLTILGYGVVVISIVGLFFDLVNTFDLGSELTVLGLLVLAAILFALRTRFDSQNRLLNPQQARYLIAVVSVLAAVILITDVVTGGLAYELQPESRIEIDESPRERLQVATVTVTNPTPLPERVETPDYAACAAGDWSEYRYPADPDREERPPVRAHLNVEDGYNEHVMSFGSKTYPVRLHIEATNTTGETFRVERTDECPDDDSGAPYIAIYEGAGNGPRMFP